MGSEASASDLDDYVTALGYAVEGVQDSGDDALISAASDVEDAANSGDYDQISAALPAFGEACSAY